MFLAIFGPLKEDITLKKAFKLWKTIYVRVHLIAFYQKNNIIDVVSAQQRFCGPKNAKMAIGTENSGITDTCIQGICNPVV